MSFAVVAKDRVAGTCCAIADDLEHEDAFAAVVAIRKARKDLHAPGCPVYLSMQQSRPDVSPLSVTLVSPGDLVWYDHALWRVAERLPARVLGCVTLIVNEADGHGGWKPERVALIYPNASADAELVVGGAQSC